MGRLAADDMVATVDTKTALYWHLRSNHYPPVHSDFIPTAEQAIEYVNKRQGQVPIVMPNGLTKTAYEIVEGLHLDSFLSDDLYYDEV